MRESVRRSLRGDKLSVNELVDLLPPSYLHQLAEELAVDKWVRKLKAGTIFKLVLYSILNSERLSLRVMEDNFKDPMFQAMSPLFSSEQVTWTGIRERLMKLKIDFCRKLYETVYEKADQMYGGKSLEGYHLKRYDSTMITTFSHLLEGIKVGNSSKGKTQIKLTTELKDDFLIQMHFHKDQALLSEETALKQAILHSPHTAKEISIFDKGLKSRKTFEQLDQQGILFVGRLNENARYELLHPIWQDDGSADTDELEFMQDSAVHLYKGGTQVLTLKLRLVQFRLKKNGQSLYFLTNVWELPAPIIAQIYSLRWDIEVLFRFLKQEMNLSHFVCNDLNAIQVMLYFTMIAAMLLLIYKKHNNIQSYKKAKIRFFKELFYSLILDILDAPQGAEWLKNTAKNFIQRE